MRAFNFKAVQAASLRQAVQSCIDETRASLRTLQKKSSWENLDAMDAVLTRFYNTTMPLQFLRLTSDDANIRTAATESQALIEKFELEFASNPNLYQLIKQTNTSDDKEAERAKALYLRDFELLGAAHLAPDVQAKVSELKNKIVELEGQFNKNVADDTTCVYFTREELDGLDESFISNLEQKDGRFKLVLDYPVSGPVMMLAKKEETRKQMWMALSQKAREPNYPLLPRIVEMRRQVAQLQGFRSDAELALSNQQRMVGNSIEEAQTYLESLRVLLEKKKDAEVKELESLKGGQLYGWDKSYYGNIRMKEKYSIDHELVKEYFPLEHVLKGVLKCYSTLLGLRFERDKDAEANAWHSDVHAFQMFDAESGQFLARFYLDLHPRPGKYTHAACWWFGKRGSDPDSLPQVCMVTNFTEKTADRPALLRFSEVETFFHEFGHVCHACLSRNRYQRLNWTWKAVEMDVLEIPSMCFEKFIFDPEILATLSSHHKTGETLPEKLRTDLVRAKNSSEGTAWTRLICMAELDFLIHGPNPPPVEEWAEFSAQLTRTRFNTLTPIVYPSWCSWQHMCTGYNSGYYSYLHSEVVATDLFSVFQKHGFLNTEYGMKLRKCILEPGCRETGREMVTGFLGRPTTIDAFEKAVYKEN